MWRKGNGKWRVGLQTLKGLWRTPMGEKGLAHGEAPWPMRMQSPGLVFSEAIRKD